MPTYTFNRGMADSVRDQMANVTRRLNEELDAMHGRILTTLQDWEDGARAQYDIAKAQWDAAADRMPASLNQAEIVLEQITGGYLKVEHTGANAWGGFGVK